MADLEFFWDAVCPFAWVTSRWVTEVQTLRDYEVEWRFISLKMINADRPADSYTTQHRAAHMAGLHVHRVADEVRLEHGNAAVGALYTATGLALHNGQRRPQLSESPQPFLAEMLRAAGLPEHHAAALDDDAHDAHIAADTELAFSRTGRDVGTPILTFRPGRPDEGSYFGPVISTIPRGDDALRLWDAVEVLATTSGMAELKRTNRAPLSFD